MATFLDSERKPQGASGTRAKEPLLLEADELIASCPKCKNLETVRFVDGRLVQTKRFTQRYEKVYHNCGSETPCRLYRFS